jgi:eukaryotic-like serine/threonine-protein kinase
MTPEMWERLKPLFEAAMLKPPEERARFIKEVCGENREMRDTLEKLVKANGNSTGPADIPLLNFHTFLPEARLAFAKGELVGDRFRIVRLIGSGGMGEVYEAKDLVLGRIALKTIRPDIAANTQMLSRFKKEVQLALKISGPHVCRIHDFHPSDAATRRSAFLTMEFLEGITLADKIRESGPLPWREVKTIALEICEGLRVMHEAGIIHRDLKSRNVMLANRNGTVQAVVMDFGLAREVRSATSETVSDVSAENSVAGTIDYMAPEQFAGDPLTPAADIFALGVVMYEMATGRHPFPSGTILQAAIRRGQRPPPPSSIRKGLPHRCDEIICRCLEFDPKKRYGSAKIVAEEIKDSWQAKLRRTWLRSAGVVLAVLVVASGLMLVHPIRERVQGILFSSREKHIAVLPFEIAGNDPQTQALGDGLMDSLTGKLSNLDAVNQTLWVVPASEVRTRKVHDASSALKQFGATIVVEGNFERRDPGVHLRLTLIDPKKLREIGYADIENATGDLAALESDAVTSLGRLMNLSVKDESVSDNPKQVGGAAYEDYLAGLGYMQRYDKAGNLDAAIKYLDRAVSTDPHFALGFAELGEAYRLKYQLDRNPEWLPRAQDYCSTAIKLDRRVSSAYITLARIHEITGREQLALQEFQRAVDNDQKDANALNGLAHAYENNGHNADAEAAFKKAASMRPDFWDSYNELGNFYDRQGRFSQAISEYKKALELSPDNAQVYANLGATYLDSGDVKMFSDADHALHRSLSLDSSNYYAFANLGFLYGFEKRYAEAAAMTERALKINEHDWRVWAHLIVLYDRLEQSPQIQRSEEKTLQLVQQAIKIEPEDAEAQSMLAALYARRAQRSEALERIQSSLAPSPDNPQVLSNVAQAYELLGERALASGYVRKALEKGQNRLAIQEDPHLEHLLID